MYERERGVCVRESKKVREVGVSYLLEEGRRRKERLQGEAGDRGG